jgi:hypothetical protein
MLEKFGRLERRKTEPSESSHTSMKKIENTDGGVEVFIDNILFNELEKYESERIDLFGIYIKSDLLISHEYEYFWNEANNKKSVLYVRLGDPRNLGEEDTGWSIDFPTAGVGWVEGVDWCERPLTLRTKAFEPEVLSVLSTPDVVPLPERTPSAEAEAQRVLNKEIGNALRRFANRIVWLWVALLLLAAADLVRR